MDVLKEAHEVLAARAKEYAAPLDGFGLTAKYWSALFAIPITAEQVALAFLLNKVARQSHQRKRDNLVDIAGYAGVLEAIERDEQQRIAFCNFLTRSASRKDLVNAVLYGTPFERELAEKMLAQRAVEQEEG